MFHQIFKSLKVDIRVCVQAVTSGVPSHKQEAITQKRHMEAGGQCFMAGERGGETERTPVWWTVALCQAVRPASIDNRLHRHAVN
jgi:hypothetical protein